MSEKLNIQKKLLNSYKLLFASKKGFLDPIKWYPKTAKEIDDLLKSFIKESSSDAKKFENELKDFLEKLDSGSKFLFADVNSQNNLQKKDVDGDALKTILIGPEGDFSPGERESILAKANTTSFSISKNILRSDTAVISAISLVNFINNLH